MELGGSVAKVDESAWPVARLIPVTGIGSQKEAETRAASAVLAVLSVVRDLSIAIFSPLGASKAAKATVETFTEPQFEQDGRKIRPDGIVRISYGKNSWTALVEVKTGDSKLEAGQINAYWDLAREQGFDAVITISNEIAPALGIHPTDGLRVRSNSKVAVHHISWTALLSAAVVVKIHHGVADPEQAWVLGELIRYLEHPASGAMAFDDMGPHWTSVRDAARDDALRKSDDSVKDIALRWDQLLRYAALQLGSRIGDDVQQVNPRAQHDPKTRLTHLVDALVEGSPLEGTLRVPNTVGDIEIATDLKARRTTTAVTIPAPSDRGSRARTTWLLRQLDDADRHVSVEAYSKNARTPTIATVAEARESHDALLDDGRREAVRFRVVRTTEMGAGRKTGKRSPGFIDSVIDAVETFYGDVVQNITPWTPKAKKLKVPAVEPGLEEAHDPDDHPVGPLSPYRFPNF